MAGGFYMGQNESEDVNNNQDHVSALLILWYYVIRGRSSGGIKDYRDMYDKVNLIHKSSQHPNLSSIFAFLGTI